ncbi:hypothetical protein [Candidatus Amarobacter glycogenicus]|uniref:hypothetical protein n=1 Tax=Candidatus Amarobacter glycogenicus TaxID=3140699 RepID=UPI002A0BD586|nr:hypothetical protein [Dehalococcoidia bacterium]
MTEVDTNPEKVDKARTSVSWRSRHRWMRRISATISPNENCGTKRRRRDRSGDQHDSEFQAPQLLHRCSHARGKILQFGFGKAPSVSHVLVRFMVEPFQRICLDPSSLGDQIDVLVQDARVRLATMIPTSCHSFVRRNIFSLRL